MTRPASHSPNSLYPPMPRPIAISKNRKLRYILEQQRADESEDQLVFNLRALPWAIRQELGTEVSAVPGESASVTSNLLERYGKAFRFGVESLTGAPLIDDAGAGVELVREATARHGIFPLTAECVARFPDDIIVEVGYQVWELSTSGASIVGKSELLPTSPPAESKPFALSAEPMETPAV